MAKHFCVANSNRQCDFDMLAGLSVTAIYMQRPGVCVERENVVATRKFRLGNFEGLYRLMSVVSVIENQFAVGVVGANAFQKRFGFEFCKRICGFLGATGEFQRFGQIIEIFCMAGSVVALL